MKKIVLSLAVLFVGFGFVHSEEITQDSKNAPTQQIAPEKNAPNTATQAASTQDNTNQAAIAQTASKKDPKTKPSSNAKKSKWGYNIWGPMGILKMIDFGKNNQDFAKNGILEVIMMAGPTYEIIDNLKIGANIGIGGQFDINRASYVVPVEANLLYDFNKDYSIFGGVNYSYGGLINDISIYIGTNLKGYSLRVGYIPYAFSNIGAPKLTGSGFYFSFAGLFF